MPDDDALEQVAGARVVERAEAQRVHQRDRPRAHREDVADDAADAGGRALVGLDRRRVVVALDAHRDREAVADVDRRPRPRPDRRAPTAPRSGSGRGARFDDLYEQCSDHITAYIASSSSVGSRPSSLDDRRELVVGHAELPVEGFAQLVRSRCSHRADCGPRVVARRTPARGHFAHRWPHRVKRPFSESCPRSEALQHKCGGDRTNETHIARVKDRGWLTWPKPQSEP